MTRLRLMTSAVGAAALLAGCGEATGLGLRGRWAAKGIELTARPFATELRLPCATTGRVSLPILPDSAGIIRFSTPVRGQWSSYTVDLVGRFSGDTLSATLTSTFAVGTPLVQTYTMLRDADPAFGSFFCLD